jgi:hypothetical protein
MEQRLIQPIAENLWWVIPARLAGVCKPMAEELTELQTAGISAIVSVMDDLSNLDLFIMRVVSQKWLSVVSSPQVDNTPITHGNLCAK